MIPTKQQIIDELLESMRQAGSIGTDFLEDKDKVNISIKKEWNTPAVDKLRQWLKDKDIIEVAK